MHLPPLSAIRAFEAAARHGSFTRAARELGMTQAAVSYQIKVLEERVGTPLFLRMPRQVKLTEAGRRLAPEVTSAFEVLRAAFRAVREDAGDVLTLTVLHTFASNWLVPRLGAFQLAHPRLAVRLDTSQRLVDFAREEVDAGIRTGEGRWPGLQAHRLFPIAFTPVLSPQLCREAGGLKRPDDLLRLPLIGPDDPWWARWFALAGVRDAPLSSRPEISLGMQQMDGALAASGHGVAIVVPTFFRAELASGRLVQPFDILASDGHDYWFVYPPARRLSPKIKAFRDWLLAEVGRDAANEPGNP